jgi:hypothetical protein
MLDLGECVVSHGIYLDRGSFEVPFPDRLIGIADIKSCPKATVFDPILLEIVMGGV